MLVWIQLRSFTENEIVTYKELNHSASIQDEVGLLEVLRLSLGICAESRAEHIVIARLTSIT